MDYILSRLSLTSRKIVTFTRQPAILGLIRFLSIGSVSLSAVLTLFALQALEGQWTWMFEVRDGLARHSPQLSSEMLPIPVAFLLWVRLMERTGGKFTLFFSPFFGAVTVAAFIATQELVQYPDPRQYVFAAGVVAGLFILAPFKECMQRVIKQPRPAIIAVVAATAACNYYWLMRTIWTEMCGWTMQSVYALLRLFHFSAESFIDPDINPNSFVIHSPFFSILVYPACNGLEGIFLFNFMLSVLLLLDWDLFKDRVILLLYELGIIYMFLFNILRISLFFMLGYWAYNPAAWGWLHSWQGTPMYLFHSYVGWVFYLIAFGIFAAWMYGSVKPAPSNGK